MYITQTGGPTAHLFALVGYKRYLFDSCLRNRYEGQRPILLKIFSTVVKVRRMDRTHRASQGCAAVICFGGMRR
jgi:hypothetical protein